jgi:hypothetical protein
MSDNVIFGKTEDGDLIAIDAETKQPVLKSGGRPMSPAEYYRHIEHPVTEWTVREKTDFIAKYGGAAYKRFREQSTGADHVSVQEKVEHIKKYGFESFKKNFGKQERASKLKKTGTRFLK